MHFLTSPRLDTFARLLAKGYPPMLAAYRAGYANFSHERSEIRAALPEVIARVAGLRPGAAPRAARETVEPHPAEEAPLPPFKPMMSDAEWLAKYAPRLQAGTGVAG